MGIIPLNEVHVIWT